MVHITEANTLPILAICYDFDKTLSPDDMQAQGYIQKTYGNDADSIRKFWDETDRLSHDNEMEQNLAWMYLMQKYSHGKVILTKKNLQDFGKKVHLFEGVETWFKRINEFGKEHGVQVEHYIISSGLKEMIEGTPIAKEFTKIFASSFLFDKQGVAIWPAQAVNYTNKTQFLFRIEKGVLDVNDKDVNNYFPAQEYRVPFRNMVYIGDSDTDIPCMKLVNTNGGHAIGVYDPQTEDKSKVYRMLDENRIKYFEAADYREGSDLERLVKNIIERTRANEELEKAHYSNLKEKNDFVHSQDEQAKRVEELIDRLEDSNSFKDTHAIIAQLTEYARSRQSNSDSWTTDQVAALIRVASTNSQVNLILSDPDISEFYRSLCGKTDSEEAHAIGELLG
ncbi:haloacid dehalogenase-like hydrolase [Alloscardovia theropitheci]|uniref:Haloacid dehalogenase-like hydrolase n=1 Tax=Alloscardovia theropitheci TaxID=2496842 RepID=A0A4R0QX94_9BIFI|nr:HAD family hydrolase [Alloscardovia theropitheci]TCD54170.1 haloacid dehalogenase-like hydrolase [Alloscardovia theropitheci]